MCSFDVTIIWPISWVIIALQLRRAHVTWNCTPRSCTCHHVVARDTTWLVPDPGLGPWNRCIHWGVTSANGWQTILDFQKKKSRVVLSSSEVSSLKQAAEVLPVTSCLESCFNIRDRLFNYCIKGVLHLFQNARIWLITHKELIGVASSGKYQISSCFEVTS